MYTPKITAPKTWHRYDSKKYRISIDPGKPIHLCIPLLIIMKQITRQEILKPIGQIIKQK